MAVSDSTQQSERSGNRRCWRTWSVVGLVVVLVLCLGTIASLRARIVTLQSEDRVAQRLLAETNRLAMAVEQAEASVRTVGLTGAADQLDGFDADARLLLSDYGSHLDDSANTDLTEQLVRIRSLATRQLDTLAEFATHLREGDAVLNAESERDRALADGFQTIQTQRQELSGAIAQFASDREQEQQDRDLRVRRWQRRTDWAQWGALAIGATAGGGAYYLFSRLERDLSTRDARLQETNAELQEANARLQATFDGVADGIVVLAAGGTIESCNRAAAQVLGYTSPDEAIGTPLASFIVSADPEASTLEYLDRITSGQFRELQGQRRDGSQFPLEIGISNLQWEGTSRCLALVRDISDRKAARARLDSQARLLDAANDAILVRDWQDRITYWNPAAEKLYGWSAAEAIGQTASALLATEFPEDPAAIAAEFRDRGEWKGELIRTTKSGERAIVAATWSLQTDEDGLPIANLEIDKDITASKAVEETLRARTEKLTRNTAELARATKNLERRNRELDQFAYIVSHDLKAPLRAIANLSGWIEEDLAEVLEGDTRHQMDLLRGRVRRMQALIDGLLQYSRVGRVETPLETVNLRELLDEVVDSLAPPEEIAIALPEDLPMLTTERVLLQQVFANLIGNAIKHRDRPDGHVWIDACPLDETNAGDRDVWEFGVSDDGPGIAPEYREKIFIMFQTLKPRDRAENTGVGLALIEKILHDRGDEIRVESAIGGGTRFAFTWHARSQADF